MNFLITLNLFAKNQSSEVDYGIVSVIMSSFLGRRKLTNQKGKYAEEVTCVRINDCDSCVNCVCVCRWIQYQINMIRILLHCNIHLLHKQMNIKKYPSRERMKKKSRTKWISRFLVVSSFVVDFFLSLASCWLGLEVLSPILSIYWECVCVHFKNLHLVDCLIPR